MKQVWNTICFLLLVIVFGIGQCLSQPRATGTGRLLIMRESNLYLMDTNGTHRQELAKNVKAAAISPDGELVAYADARGIKVLALTEGKVQTLVAFREGLVQLLAWSPGQKAVAYELLIPNREEALYLAAYPFANTPPRRLATSYGGISFSPDGKYILNVNPAAKAGSAGSVLERIDTESGKVETLYVAPSLLEEARYSPDGSRIALLVPSANNSSNDEPTCVSPPNSIWILDLNRNTPTKVDLKSIGDPAVSMFSWSPDSKRMSFDSGGDQCDYPGTIGDIYEISVDQKEIVKLSDHVPSRHPTYSPDGRSVLFTDFSQAYKSGAPVLMMADLVTRQLKPLAGQAGKGPDSAEFDVVMDWR